MNRLNVNRWGRKFDAIKEKTRLNAGPISRNGRWEPGLEGGCTCRSDGVVLFA